MNDCNVACYLWQLLSLTVICCCDSVDAAAKEDRAESQSDSGAGAQEEND